MALNLSQQKKKTTNSLSSQIGNYQTRLKSVGQSTDTRNPLEKALNLKENQNVLFDIFELIGRPQQAVFGAIDAAQTGGDAWQGALEGISGQKTTSGGQLLRNAGVGDDGEEANFLDPTTWGLDDIGGFALDIFADPMDLALWGTTVITGGATAPLAIANSAENLVDFGKAVNVANKVDNARAVTAVANKLGTNINNVKVATDAAKNMKATKLIKPTRTVIKKSANEILFGLAGKGIKKSAGLADSLVTKGLTKLDDVRYTEAIKDAVDKGIDLTKVDINKYADAYKSLKKGSGQIIDYGKSLPQSLVNRTRGISRKLDETAAEMLYRNDEFGKMVQHFAADSIDDATLASYTKHADNILSKQNEIIDSVLTGKANAADLKIYDQINGFKKSIFAEQGLTSENFAKYLYARKIDGDLMLIREARRYMKDGKLTDIPYSIKQLLTNQVGLRSQLIDFNTDNITKIRGILDKYKKEISYEIGSYGGKVDNVITIKRIAPGILQDEALLNKLDNIKFNRNLGLDATDVRNIQDALNNNEIYKNLIAAQDKIYDDAARKIGEITGMDMSKITDKEGYVRKALAEGYVPEGKIINGKKIKGNTQLFATRENDLPVLVRNRINENLAEGQIEELQAKIDMAYKQLSDEIITRIQNDINELEVKKIKALEKHTKQMTGLSDAEIKARTSIRERAAFLEANQDEFTRELLSGSLNGQISERVLKAFEGSKLTKKQITDIVGQAQTVALKKMDIDIAELKAMGFDIDKTGKLKKLPYNIEVQKTASRLNMVKKFEQPSLTKEIHKAKNTGDYKKAIDELNTSKYANGTYDLKTLKPVEFKDGYQFSFSQTSDKYSVDDFNKIVNGISKKTKSDIYLGKFDGVPEASFYVKNEDEAMQIAKMFNQQSIYDWSKHNTELNPFIENPDYVQELNKVSDETIKQTSGKVAEAVKQTKSKLIDNKIEYPTYVDIYDDDAVTAYNKLYKEVQDATQKSKKIIAYHGSNNKFDTFDKNMINQNETDAVFNGFWFSSNKQYASPAKGSAKFVNEYELDLKNPAPYDVYKKVAEDARKEIDATDIESYPTFVRMKLQEMGYDGVIYQQKPSKYFDINTNSPEIHYKTVRNTDRTLVRQADGTYDLYNGKVPNDTTYVTNVGTLKEYDDFESETYIVFEPNQIKKITAADKAANEFTSKASDKLMFKPSNVKEAKFIKKQLDTIDNMSDDVFKKLTTKPTIKQNDLAKKFLNVDKFDVTLADGTVKTFNTLKEAERFVNDIPNKFIDDLAITLGRSNDDIIDALNKSGKSSKKFMKELRYDGISVSDIAGDVGYKSFEFEPTVSKAADNVIKETAPKVATVTKKVVDENAFKKALQEIKDAAPKAEPVTEAAQVATKVEEPVKSFVDLDKDYTELEKEKLKLDKLLAKVDKNIDKTTAKVMKQQRRAFLSGMSEGKRALLDTNRLDEITKLKEKVMTKTDDFVRQADDEIARLQRKLGAVNPADDVKIYKMINDYKRNIEVLRSNVGQEIFKISATAGIADFANFSTKYAKDFSTLNEAIVKTTLYNEDLFKVGYADEILKNNIPFDKVLVDKMEIRNKFTSIKDLLPKKTFDDVISKLDEGDSILIDKDIFNLISNKYDEQSLKPLMNIINGFNNTFKKFNTISPGFHVRNITGNLTNMWLSGAPVHQMGDYYRQSVNILNKANALSKKAADGLLEGIEKTEYAQLQKFISGGWTDTYKQLLGVEETKGIGQKIFDLSNSWNTAIDNTNRLALMLYADNNPKYLAKLGVDNSLDAVRKVLFDPKNMSPFEEKYLKKIIPFYTFAKQNLIFQVDNLSRNTPKYNKLIKSFNKMYDNVFESENDYQEWQKNGFNVPLPFKDSKGNNLFIKLNLPLSDLGEYAENPLRRVVASTSPLIKTPFEQVSGVDMFTGLPVKTTNPFELLLNNTGVSNVTTKQFDKIEKLLTPENTATQNLATLIPTLLSYNDVTKSQQANQYKQLSEYQQLVKRLEKQGYNIPTMKELTASARMSKTRLARARQNRTN